MRTSLLTALALLLAAGGAAAQGPPGGGGGGRTLSAQGEQDLTFGDIIPGVPHTVLPSDPVAAGRIRITGQGRAEVLVDFLLPTQLTGPGGASVPLQFGPGSAGYSPDETVDNQTAFDPTTSETITLPPNGRGTLFLGGTADPASGATAGPHSATLTLTLSYVAN